MTQLTLNEATPDGRLIRQQGERPIAWLDVVCHYESNLETHAVVYDLSFLDFQHNLGTLNQVLATWNLSNIVKSESVNTTIN